MSVETFGDLMAALGAFRKDCLRGEPSNRAIARALGVVPQTVTNWFSGAHFPDQDAGAPVKMVRMIKASAEKQGVAAPEGLLDADRWREAHRAEAARRQGRASDAAVRTRAQRAAAPGLFLGEAADPLKFEVHPPVRAQRGYSGLPALPPYVRREHDEKLAGVSRAARDGRSGIAVLVGDSSTGKTRACWETLKTLATPAVPNESWRLWHPLEPSPAKAASQALPLVAPRTVIWLNEAQRYLAPSDGSGEELAAGLWELLRDPSRGPVLILATLWDGEWRKLTGRPGSGEPDPHALARGLLSGHEIIVPAAFSQDNLRDLAGASDPRLRQAARMAPDGRVTQFIAGAPELLTRYHTANRVTKALITAAMDARRLGMGEAIPLSFLEAAVPAYLDEEGLETIEDEADWLERSLAEAVKRVKGIPGPLARIRLKGQAASPRTRYRLADYLDEYGRRERHATIPRAEFWDAIAVHAGSGDLWALARAARSRGLLRYAASMDKRAALHGDAAAALALMKQMRANDADMGNLPDQIIERIGLGQLEFIPELVNILHWSGASRQLSLLLARVPEPFASPDDSYWAILLARALLEAHEDERAAALGDWLAANTSVSDPGEVAELAEMLQDAGLGQQLAVLLARDPAAHVSLKEPESIAFLAGRLAEAGATDQLAILAARVAQSFPAGDPEAVARLAGGFARWGMDNRQAVVALTSDLVAHADFGDPRVVADLLHVLECGDAAEQIQLLLQRDPASSVSLDDVENIVWLLEMFSSVGAEEQIQVLMARDPASHVFRADVAGAMRLMGCLRRLGFEEHADAILARAHAMQVNIEDPQSVTLLLNAYLSAGMTEQAAALLARDPAAHVLLDDSQKVADLLHALSAAGAGAQVSSLAARAAADTVFRVLWTPGGLPKAMREMGQGAQADLVEKRILDEGKLQDYNRDGMTRYRFGREPDGTPAEPWAWDDLL
jgi:uncharacterized protein YidB (DUF937 family)